MRKSKALNFGKTLLDAPLKRKQIVRDNKFYLVPLPKPLQPTPYEPPKPVPKPRQRKKAPIASPGNVNRVVSEKVKKIKKLIDEITPYYSPEAMDKFKENLKFIQRAEITQKKNAIKNNALSFEVTIVNNYDPSIQLADTRGILKEKLIGDINSREEKRNQILYYS